MPPARYDSHENIVVLTCCIFPRSWLGFFSILCTPASLGSLSLPGTECSVFCIHCLYKLTGRFPNSGPSQHESQTPLDSGDTLTKASRYPTEIPMSAAKRRRKKIFCSTYRITTDLGRIDRCSKFQYQSPDFIGEVIMGMKEFTNRESDEII